MNTQKYTIVSDGSCDLPPELVEKYGLVIVPFYVSFDERNYKKEIVEIPVRDFYQQMVDNKGVYPKSSLPSVQDYVDAFLPIVKKGEAIICICITEKFSGSLQSATNARAIILEEYPDAQIAVINSTVNTVLQGIYVLEAVKLRDQGVDFEESVKRLDEIKSSGRIFFTVGDFEYLRHGGRIGKVAGAAVSVLGIKPLITLKEGEIFASGITRSRKKSMDMICSMLVTYLKENGGNVEDYHICIGYGYDIEEAKVFQDKVMQELEKAGMKLDELHMYQIGATIAVHTGPYPLGVGVILKA